MSQTWTAAQLANQAIATSTPNLLSVFSKSVPSLKVTVKHYTAALNANENITLVNTSGKPATLIGIVEYLRNGPLDMKNIKKITVGSTPVVITDVTDYFKIVRVNLFDSALNQFVQIQQTSMTFNMGTLTMQLSGDGLE